MTSQESISIGPLHVDSSTNPTTSSSPMEAPLEAMNNDTSKAPPTSELQHTRQNVDTEVRPTVSVTETGRLENVIAVSDSETSSPELGPASSMVVTVTTTTSHSESSVPLVLAPERSDVVKVSSASDDRDLRSNELDDMMSSSPHGNNAIVERSPGERYLRFMEKLGSGASKEVYRAYDTQEGIEVAWNVVHLAGVPKNERIRIVNEVRLLERLHHHNIISFHGSWVNREKQQVNFVTEILSSGTLQSFIKKVQVIRWKIAKRWALQILKGLEYLHSQDPPVIHRDLKCENIFINGTSGDLRIGDLGLSTVHQNGKALSVLGTPEFMAPDMYEETAYDEKVDIYAFGMCLLEIFTKEIPYRECANPAQIYKKVIRGDPPDSLKRLKSRHARDFIVLCLGTKDENGSYVRPSATELIAHPFLQFRPADDGEVEVDPPMHERAIKEGAETSSGGDKVANAVAKNHVKVPLNGIISAAVPSAVHVPTPPPSAASSTINTARDLSVASSDEIGPDTYEEMPDSESVSRQPKVLIGRGQELQREEAKVPPAAKETTVRVPPNNGEKAEFDVPAVITNAVAAQLHTPVPAPERPPSTPAPVQLAQTQNLASPFHFLVAAAVLEDEFSNTRPYGDDILKLVVTLPVEGQTQNVQFDFHLVEDDAIQVAKEMVAELGIPQAAVLEISETISGLARAARVKQDKYVARINQTHHQRSSSMSQSLSVLQQLDHLEMQAQNPSIGHSGSMATHSPIPDHLLLPSMEQQQGQLGQQHASTGALQSADPPAQNQSLNHVGEVEHPIKNSPVVSGHNPQQGWSAHPLVNETASTPSPQDPSFEPILIVKTISNSNQASVPAPVPPFVSHVPMQHHHITVQSQGQSQDDQGNLSQLHMQQQTINNVQQHASTGQPPYAQPPSQQQQVDGSHLGYGTVPAVQQHAKVQSQSQHQQQPQTAHAQGPTIVQQTQQGIPKQTQVSQIAFDYSQSSARPLEQQNLLGSGLSVPGASGPTSQPFPPSHEQQVQGQYLLQSQTPAQPIQRVSLTPPNQAYGQTISIPPQPMQAQRPHSVLQQQTQPVQPGKQPVLPYSHSGQDLGGAPQLPVKPVPPTTVGIQPIPRTQSRPIVGDEATSSSADKIVSRLPTSGSFVENPVIPEPKKKMNGVHEVVSADSEDEDLNDDKLAAELRKLDEDFEKTMARAQKVFDTRMDTLSRTQVQREAQHQKTLEKHEKERADFEKRRQQEEIEQNRRIEQLKRDWAKRREAMSQKKQMEEGQVSGPSLDLLDSSSGGLEADRGNSGDSPA